MALILAVGDWILAATEGGTKASPRAEVLRDCADLVDVDPWRKAMRKAVKDTDLAALTSLSLEVVEKRVPVMDMVLLARALDRVGGRDAAAQLLRRASALYPSDFWVYYELGSLLSNDRSRDEECIFSFRTAIALLPGST